MDIKKTASLFANFTIKRIAEIFGITIFGVGVLLLLALLTYSPEDPNFIFPENTKIENILGFHGSFVSDIFFQSIGLVSYFFSFTLILTGINIIRSKEFFLIIENIFFTIIYCIFGTLFVPISNPDTNVGTQLTGVIAVCLFSFILSYIVFRVLKATIGLRISAQAEKLGTDVAEVGVKAYAIRD